MLCSDLYLQLCNESQCCCVLLALDGCLDCSQGHHLSLSPAPTNVHQGVPQGKQQGKYLMQTQHTYIHTYIVMSTAKKQLSESIWCTVQCHWRVDVYSKCFQFACSSGGTCWTCAYKPHHTVLCCMPQEPGTQGHQAAERECDQRCSLSYPLLLQLLAEMLTFPVTPPR